MISKIQRDALKEYLNISIGDAASLLSEMTNEKISLTVPKVELFSRYEEKKANKRLDIFPNNGHIVSTSLSFGEKINGESKLVFPADKSKRLVGLCTKEKIDPDIEMDGLTDADFDVIREIGNIILNAILGGLGNLLDTKIEYELPEVEVLFLEELQEQINDNKNTYFLLIFNDFTIGKTTIQGAILIVFNINSISYLFEKIDEIVGYIYD
jgi:chemotaxis protein CheC